MSCARFVAVCALLGISVAASADDLKGILERDRLAIQKVTSDVNTAIADSKTYERSDPAKAKFVLDRALSQVNNSTVLPDSQRQDLRKRIQTRLGEVNTTIRIQQQAAEEAVQKAAIAKIKADQEKTTSSIAEKRIFSTKDQLAAAATLREKQAKGLGAAFAGLQASATPIEGYVEYPAYWKQLTENRDKIVGNKMSPKEIALLKALNSVMSVDFENAKFKEVIEYLQEKTGQAIILDEGSLREAMVEYDDPVNFKIKKITVRTILKKVLADRGLGYVLKDGVIQVMTAQKAREIMVVRSYPVDSLVGPINQAWGPFVNRAIMLQNVQQLITTIQNAVEPQLWSINGGPGTITFYEPTMSIIVRAPAETHYMFGGSGLLGR